MRSSFYYLIRYYSSTGSAAAALIVSIKQPPLSLSVSNYAIIGFLLSSTQLRKTSDFCYHESVTHAGISSYGPESGVPILRIRSLRGYSEILNSVLLRWAERNLGRYEHARARRTRARAPRAPYDSVLRSYYSCCCCGCVFVHKLQGKVTTAQVDTCTLYQKKVPKYRYPLYRSTGIWFKKVVLKG